MKRQIQPNAAAPISDAARKVDTSPEHVRVPSQQSSGPSGGSTTVRPAVNMDGAAATVTAIYRAVVQNLSALGRIRFNSFLATFDVFLR